MENIGLPELALVGLILLSVAVAKYFARWIGVAVLLGVVYSAIMYAVWRGGEDTRAAASELIESVHEENRSTAIHNYELAAKRYQLGIGTIEERHDAWRLALGSCSQLYVSIEATKASDLTVAQQSAKRECELAGFN